MPNRLRYENSPYLIQHADNPVDWYPWGEEALEKARLENKPVFLSIGYAACHWCHVMAHESFEDPETAALMNKHFINIKVDREERPDLDNIYMSAVVAMTGQGGWPMSVFATPEGQPFFGGTYFPPVRRYNIPSFRELLLSVNNIWERDREQVLKSAENITAYLKNAGTFQDNHEELNDNILDQAVSNLAQAYDWKFGGWGSAPKFPQPMAIEFLLRRSTRGDQLALDIAIHALDAMARGGMYDVVGGGYARYSTDNTWKVPHFEKMLYDNAQLTLVYLHAYLLTGNVMYRDVVVKTLGFIQRELADPLGGLYSSLDADSEGEEGKYYVWSLAELNAALQDPGDAEFYRAAYSVMENGNFEGSNILQRALPDQDLVDRFHLPLPEVSSRLEKLNARLLEYRQSRVRPVTDDKVLTMWNALALMAFSEAARYLDSDFIVMAIRISNFLTDRLYQNGMLLRSWRKNRAQYPAYLEDYAALILALLSLYQGDPNPKWFDTAIHLADEMLSHFRDPQGGFFDTRIDQVSLILRPKDLQDNATPSGNALAAAALLQLSHYTGRSDWRELAEQMLASISSTAVRYPNAFSFWLCAIDFGANPVQEVAILGDHAAPATQGLIDVLWSQYRPNLISACASLPLPPQSPALLHNRPLVGGLPTAYVCENMTCRLPVSEPGELSKQLELSPKASS